MRLLSRIISSILCISLPLQAMAQDVQFIYRMSVDGSLPEGNYTSAGDYTPDAFSFTDKVNIQPSTAVISDPVTISGIDTTAGVSIEGGCYLINDEDVSACHAEPGTLVSGDRIRVRLMSSPSYETTTQARISVGGVSDTFSVCTRTQPVTVQLGPDAEGTPPDGQVTVDYTFDFATLANIDGGAVDQPARVQELTWNVINGTIPEGLFFSEATGLLFGEPTTSEETTFSVAASHPDGATDDEVYSITIMPEPNAPDGFFFTPLAGVEPGVELFSEEITLAGLERTASVSITGPASAGLSINGGAPITSGTVDNGDKIRVRIMSPNTYGGNSVATFAVGEFSAEFSVTVRSTDNSPDAFTFVSMTEQGPNIEVISAPTVLSGFEGSVRISVSGSGTPSYSVNENAWTSDPGTALAGDAVRVKLTSGPANTSRAASLTVGDVTGTFTVTSALEDGTPDLLAFAPVTDVVAGAVIASSAAAVTGINIPIAVSLSGEGSPEYQINSGAWASEPGTVSVGDLVAVRLTAGTAGTTRTVTLLLGDLQVPFSVSTVAADITPDAFEFTPALAAPSQATTVGPVLLTGFEGSIPVSISGHATALYSLDGLAFTAEPGTINPGAEVWMKITSSPTEGSVHTAVFTAGTGSAEFSVTTQDLTPNAFVFADATDVEPATVTVSNDQTISSITGAVAISVSGNGSPEYRLNGGSWTSQAGTVQAGDVVSLRLTSGAISTTRVATLTIGTNQSTFSVTSRAELAPPVTITLGAATLPSAFLTTAYSYDLKQLATVSGGPAGSPATVEGLSWSVGAGSGTLPAGLSLNAQTGVISGTPNTEGPGSFQIVATELDGAGQQVYSITVNGLTFKTTKLAVGGAHICGITTTGGVKCWGSNSSGQLGDGTTTSSIYPVTVVGLPGTVTDLSAGGSTTCAVTSAGAAYCWGYSGTYGLIGDGGTENRLTPTLVSGLSSGVTSIAAPAASHGCAVQSGTAKCWGKNYSGQLGNGTKVDSPTPVTVSGLTGVTAVTNGWNGSCAIASGAAKCWGSGLLGENGNGTTSNSLTPVQVSGMTSGVVEIRSSSSTSCARTSAGAVKCWGAGQNGGTGDGSLTSHSSPASATGLTSGVKALAAGDSSFCAITSTNTVRCWGYNSMGEVGNGTQTQVNISVQALASATQIVMGRTTTCAIGSSTTSCWGQNTSSQVNSANTSPVLSPITVARVTP